MTRFSLLLPAMLLAAQAGAQTPPDATRIGRSAVPKAPEFQELYDFDAAAKTLGDATFPYESRLHRAHVVMLAERGIVTRADAAAILCGLTQVDGLAKADPALRTYLPYEAALIRTIGPVAGRMHTGRSRNNLANTVNRMFYRDQINRTVKALLALRVVLAAKAADNLDTVMVVYDRATGCQFSFTCDGSIKRRTRHFGRSAARRAARAALAGRVFADVGRATHYHADWMVPYWRDTMTKVAKIDTTSSTCATEGGQSAASPSQQWTCSQPPRRAGSASADKIARPVTQRRTSERWTYRRKAASDGA